MQYEAELNQSNFTRCFLKKNLVNTCSYPCSLTCLRLIWETQGSRLTRALVFLASLPSRASQVFTDTQYCFEMCQESWCTSTEVWLRENITLLWNSPDFYYFSKQENDLKMRLFASCPVDRWTMCAVFIHFSFRKRNYRLVEVNIDSCHKYAILQAVPE